MNGRENIEESIRKLRRKSSEETDRRILDEAFAAIGEAAQSQAQVRRIRKRIIVLAATAVIIMAVLIGVEMKTRRSEQPVQEAVRVVAVTGEETEAEAAAAAEGKRKLDAEVEAELNNAIRMFTAGDVNGLVAMLSKGKLEGKLAAAFFLAKIGDTRAIGGLEKLSVELGEGEPNNPFATAVTEIKGRVEQEKKMASAIKADNRKYIHGWLIDANDNIVKGRILLRSLSGQVGDVKVTTGEDGAFSIRTPNYKESGAVVGQALNAEGNLGCFFVWTKNEDVNDVEIIVKPLAGVSGTVVDSNATAVTDFKLETMLVRGKTAYTGGMGEVVWKSSIEADGSFEIESIPTGAPLQLTIRKDGYKTWVKVVDLAAGKNTDLGQVVLEPQRGIKPKTKEGNLLFGFIVNEGGEPIAGAKVSTIAGKEIEADANGWYELQGLPAGVLSKVSVYADGYGSSTFEAAVDGNDFDIQIFPQGYELYGGQGPELFVEKWVNTEPVTLEQFLGKVVLLQVGGLLPMQDYRLQVQRLQELQAEYGERGLAVIAIHQPLSVKRAGEVVEEAIESFIVEQQIRFPFGIDMESPDSPKESFRTGNGATYNLYEAKASPALFLIDKQGRLRISPPVKGLEGWIERLLAE